MNINEKEKRLIREVEKQFETLMIESDCFDRAKLRKLRRSLDRLCGLNNKKLNKHLDKIKNINKDNDFYLEIKRNYYLIKLETKLLNCFCNYVACFFKNPFKYLYGLPKSIYISFSFFVVGSFY